MHKHQSLVVTVSRNDGNLLNDLLKSIENQTTRPIEWVIVIDPLTQKNEQIISSFSDGKDWIKVVRIESSFNPKTRGERIARLFNFGVSKSSLDWTFCSKIDADMDLEELYFEKLFLEFSKNPKLGIASGNCLVKTTRGQRMERVTKGHTRGGLKTYRRECYDEIGGVEHVDGWDTIDNVMARLYGWETSNFENILAAQARPTGVSVGLISTAFNEGKKSYFLGYFAPYLLARAAHRMLSKPYFAAGIAMLGGFLYSMISLDKKYKDTRVRKNIRNTQISKITFGLLK